MNYKSHISSINFIIYNSVKPVLETLENLKLQSHDSTELIIINDTVIVYKKVTEKLQCYFENTNLLTVKKDTGIFANYNCSISTKNEERVKIIFGNDILISESFKNLTYDRFLHFIYKYLNPMRLNKNSKPSELIYSIH